MKRLPLMLSLLAVIALSASVAYWVLELYKPPQRPLAAISEAALPEPSPDAAATLFGGQALAVVASNYQLTGVVAAGAEGVAILVADGQPPKALKVGAEIAPGVTVREVHPRYVMLAEGGVLKRIDLAADDKPAANMMSGTPAPGYDPNQQAMEQQQQQQQPQQPPPQVQDVQGGSTVQPNQPMEVPNNMPGNMPAGVPPPPPPVQMPVPTRNFSNNPGGQPPTQ
jgi:general secretion pathway protein C